MFEARPLSKNRLFIYHFLQRAKKYHCPISFVFEWDVTDTLETIKAIRKDGRRTGLVAYVIKATAMILEQYPRLNHRLFHTVFGIKEVSFDHISCNILIARKNAKGEEILVPAIVKNANQMTAEEIHTFIQTEKNRPLEASDSARNMDRMKRLPEWLIKLVHFKFRSDPAFTEARVGTYGVSAVIHLESGGVGGHAPSTQTAFFPTNIQKRVVPYKGEIAVRDMITFGVVLDHYIVDGMDVYRGMRDLKKLMEDPSKVLGDLSK